MRNKNINKADPNTFVSNPGDKFHINYEPMVNADGTIDLVESGKDDIQAMIDSYIELTDMAYILKKMEQGDDSVLNHSVPIYGDFTQMPKSYAEALQMVIDAESAFYKLPVDIRNKFDNDYKQWFAQAGNNEWFNKMGYKEASDEVKEVEEVKTE